MRFVRRRLNASAFGINWYELGPGQVGREHDESDTGQEEVYVVVRGLGDDDASTARSCRSGPGRSSASTPKSVRVPTAGDAGLTFVAVGSPPGGSYEPRGPF